MAAVLGACGDNAEGTPDASLPDAGIDAPGVDAAPPTDLARHDWTGAREDPFTTSSVELAGETIYAASSSTFATRAHCDAETGACDYTWRLATSGAVHSARPHLAPYTGTMISPDATRMLVVDETARSVCNGSTVIEGALEVVRLRDGVALRSTPGRTNLYAMPGWSTYGTWFVDGSLGATACTVNPLLRTGLAPFTASSLGDDLYASLELADRKMVAQADAYGIVDPRTPNSFEPWSDGIDTVSVAGGWVHAFDGWALTATRIFSRDEHGTTRTLEVPSTTTYYMEGPSYGRVAFACGDVDAEGNTPCEVLDLLGTRPVHEIAGADLTQSRASIAFLGDRAVVVGARSAAGELTFSRIDLETGARTELHRGAGTLHAIGDGRAAILQHASGAVLVEANKIETLVDGLVVQVVTFPAAGGPDRAQAELALITQNIGIDQHRLLLLDLSARRLVTLTDNLYFTPRLQAPFAYDDCGQPYTTRAAGAPFEQVTQSAAYVHFTERPANPDEPYRVFVLPLDGSRSVRQIGTSAVGVYCHAPVASTDGSLVVLQVDTGVGDTATFSFGHP